LLTLAWSNQQKDPAAGPADGMQQLKAAVARRFQPAGKRLQTCLRSAPQKCLHRSDACATANHKVFSRLAFPEVDRVPFVFDPENAPRASAGKAARLPTVI